MKQYVIWITVSLLAGCHFNDVPLSVPMAWSDRCFETYLAWTYASQKGYVAGEKLHIPEWFDFKRLSQEDAARIVRKDVWQGERVIGGPEKEDIEWAQSIVSRLKRREVCCFSFVKRYDAVEDHPASSYTIYAFVEASSAHDRPVYCDEYGVRHESGMIELWSFGNEIWPEVMDAIEVDLGAGNGVPL